MEELVGLEYGVITEGVGRSIFGLLGPALNKFISSKTGLTKEKADLATSSITFLGLSSNQGWPRRYYETKLRLFLGSGRVSRSSWLVK